MEELVPFDEALAGRIRKMLDGAPGIAERRMFGGLAFLSRGHMFVGIVGGSLMARVGQANYEDALRRPHVRRMDFTGRPMRGYVFVNPPGYALDAALRQWLTASREHVGGLPPKNGARRKPPPGQVP